MADVPYNPASDRQYLQHGHVTLNQVPTHVITCGRWLDDPLPDNEKLLVLLIPGNPGAIDYYEDFVCAMYEGLQRAVPIWAVSHAGHVAPPPGEKLPKLNDNEGLYSLEGQVIHKLAFVENYIPTDRELVLVGHSIGCFIILEILKRMPNLKVRRAFLLFPTIERMAVTPRGQWMSVFLNYFRFPALLAIYAASYMAESTQRKLISWYLNKHDLPECVIRASLNSFLPDCTRACLFMARNEFDQVQTLDVDTVNQNLKRLTFYYGAKDEWCPTSYYDDMKVIFPEGDIKLCQHKFDHAFVLDNSKEMAAIISTWMLEGILGLSKDVHAKSLLV